MRLKERHSERSDLHDLDGASDQSESIAVHTPDRGQRRSRKRYQVHMIVEHTYSTAESTHVPAAITPGGSAVHDMRETESNSGNAVRWVINLPQILRKFEGGSVGWTPGI